MKNILVPTDFSKCAENAINFALEMALAHSASLTLYHRITPVYTADTNFYAVNYLDDYYKAKQDKLRLHLKKILQSKPRFAVLKTKVAFEFGLAADNIVDAADKSKADLIIMGTQGATGLKEFFLGSTTGMVIAKSKTPVMVIPERAKFTQLKTPFLFATDFATLPSTKSVRLLNELVISNKATINVLNVLEGKINDTSDKAIEKMKSKLKDLPFEIQFVKDLDIPKAIDKYAHTIKAGALIMVAHHYNLLERMLFESLTKKVSFHTTIPLLVLNKD